MTSAEFDALVTRAGVLCDWKWKDLAVHFMSFFGGDEKCGVREAAAECAEMTHGELVREILRVEFDSVRMSLG